MISRQPSPAVDWRLAKRAPSKGDSGVCLPGGSELVLSFMTLAEIRQGALADVKGLHGIGATSLPLPQMRRQETRRPYDPKYAAKNSSRKRQPRLAFMTASRSGPSVVISMDPVTLS